MCDPDAVTLRLLLPPGPRVSPQAVESAADPTQWLFLDTETTGLAGGTGTYAFLVGLAWWDGGGMQMEQLFMRDHDEEHSVLHEIAQRLHERPVLVTFNGKSFDWPLLDTRFRMTRAIETPALAAHLDLLHPARQMWRWQLGSVRLVDLERQVLNAESLGWSRDDDIDSSRIPEFYFDYLRGGPVEPIAGVLRHNRMDLRGLAALAGRIFRTLGESGGAEPEPQKSLELYGVSRLLDRRGERARAGKFYEQALEVGLPPPIDRAARHELARLAKRQREYDRAAELWQELAASPAPSFEACEQLAIHYERRAGNPVEAERATRLALEELRRARRLELVRPGRHAQLALRLGQRLARLERKLLEAKTPGSKTLRSTRRAVKAQMRSPMAKDLKAWNPRSTQER
ncbi:MAG TPA: ribonuclease H-like domain-containing protein [Polyangiaceae bacterium]|nr:ribonuclease H-like domain-containing protein [Polyangiaceae bacterium]